MKFLQPPRGRRINPLWLIIFSDMSTNLMLFFLMLFVMTRMNSQDKAAMIKGLDEALENRSAIEARQKKAIKEDQAIRLLKDVVTYGDLRQYADIDVQDDKIKLALKLPFFFERGSAELSPKAAESLELLVKPLTDFPNDVIIEGHTDDVPILGGKYNSNWELSVARAVSVVNFFVERGASPGKLVAGGYGEYHPSYPNNDEENRARNRRIEITLMRQPSIESLQAR